MAVATSSGVKQFERKAASHRRLFGFFSHVVKGADVERGKPAPDIYLRAAGLFDGDGEVSPQDCLAFEDAPSGVASAKVCAEFQSDSCHVNETSFPISGCRDAG